MLLLALLLVLRRLVLVPVNVPVGLVGMLRHFSLLKDPVPILHSSSWESDGREPVLLLEHCVRFELLHLTLFSVTCEWRDRAGLRIWRLGRKCRLR
jgi:hypothetical protein